MFAHGLLAPIVALAAWSLIMLIWLYATRIPAMQRAGIKPGQISNDPAAPSKLPAWARNVADNYNHLMEQPTIFYAIALTLALLDFGGGINLYLAWGYVGFRILHSLIQATYNRVLHRFIVFNLASFCLLGLTVHAAMRILHDCGFI